MLRFLRRFGPNRTEHRRTVGIATILHANACLRELLQAGVAETDLACPTLSKPIGCACSNIVPADLLFMQHISPWPRTSQNLAAMGRPCHTSRAPPCTSTPPQTAHLIRHPPTSPLTDQKNERVLPQHTRARPAKGARGPGHKRAATQSRAPFSDVKNCVETPVAQRRTSTWVSTLATGIPPAVVQHESPSKSPAAKVAKPPPQGNVTASARGNSSARQPSWHVEFAGDASPSSQANGCSSLPDRLSECALSVEGDEATGGNCAPTSTHLLAQPRPGGLSQLLSKRATCVAASSAPLAASDPAERAVAASHAATAAANIPAAMRLYSSLPALPALLPKPSPSAVTKLAAQRRAAVLARRPCSNMIAPNMSDLWRVEEQVIEVRALPTACEAWVSRAFVRSV
jgi:hypothetical protein